MINFLTVVNDDIYDHNGGPIYVNRGNLVTAEEVICDCEDMDGFDMSEFKQNCMDNMTKG